MVVSGSRVKRRRVRCGGLLEGQAEWPAAGQARHGTGRQTEPNPETRKRGRWSQLLIE